MDKKNPVILRIALLKPLYGTFDYLPPQAIDPTALIIGTRIRIPFQSKTCTGFLIEIAHHTTVPEKKLKNALEVLDQQPLFSHELHELCNFAADYYHVEKGEVFSCALPHLLREGKKVEACTPFHLQQSKPEVKPSLNEAQSKAVNQIMHLKSQFNVFLLNGITGSGKTEVYMHIIDEILNAGKQILVLIPEISLTPQTLQRFQNRFNVPIVMMHSNLTHKERLNAWMYAQNGEAKIIIGTRSAVFAPCKKLGLIIVDEEHDASFKQQDRFRYHARDLAIMRAKLNHLPIILGSATPSLETLMNVERKRYISLSLPYRAGNAMLPAYQVLDLRTLPKNEGLSQPLLDLIKSHLANKNQVMLFLNRRGFAPVLYCVSCQWIAYCNHCDSRMVYHQSPPRLQCHHCDLILKTPEHCEKCGEASLKPIGLGTQKIEQTLKKYFSDIPIIRIDKDNTRRKGETEKHLQNIHDAKQAILLGTQMIAKGHHFKNVTLVGILDADHGLLSSDFRATETMGQLLIQAAGRAGRVDKKGTVAIQTHCPHHPLLQYLIQNNYDLFAKTLLHEREKSLLPPFSHFALFRAESKTHEQAHHFLDAVKRIIPMKDCIELLGPLPARMAKKRGLYCSELLIKAEKRHLLQHYLAELMQKISKITSRNKVKWSLDVDPLEV